MRRNILIVTAVCLLHCSTTQSTPITDDNAANKIPETDVNKVQEKEGDVNKIPETDVKKVQEKEGDVNKIPETNVNKVQEKEGDVTTEAVKDGETETPTNDTKDDAETATNGNELATNDTQTTSVNGTNATESNVTIEFSVGPTEYITRIPCHCVTRGPISKFKLYGNIHFPKIKVTPERYVTVPTEPSSTVCPPCECPACPSQNDLF